MKYLTDTGRRRTWKNRLFGKCWQDPNSPILFYNDSQYGWNPWQENEFADFNSLWRDLIRVATKPLVEAILAFGQNCRTATEGLRQMSEAFRQMQKVSRGI